MTKFIQSFLAEVKRIFLAERTDLSRLDKILAAITVALGAGAIAWPPGRKLPAVFAFLAHFARQVWARRAWWEPMNERID